MALRRWSSVRRLGRGGLSKQQHCERPRLIRRHYQRFERVMLALALERQVKLHEWMPHRLVELERENRQLREERDALKRVLLGTNT